MIDLSANRQMQSPGGNLMLSRPYHYEGGILQPEQQIDMSMTAKLMPQAHSQELLLLLMERYQRDDAAFASWAECAKLCVDFAEGRQWTAEELAKAADDDRPTLTLNKIATLLRLVMGYFRNNRLDNKYLPSDDANATVAIATSLTKIVKQLSTNSKQMYVDGEVFLDGMMAGRGYYDSRLNFEKNDFGDLHLSGKDPFTIRPDADANAYSPHEWGHVSEARLWSIDEVEFTFGKAIGALLQPMLWGNSYRGGVPGDMMDYINEITPWRSFGGQQDYANGADYGSVQTYLSNCVDPYRKNIRVVDFQHYVRVMQRNIVDLETGDREPIPDKFDQQQLGKMMAWCQEKFASQGKACPYRIEWRSTRRVRWTTVIGDIIVYDQWSPYETFTITPFFPYFRRGKTRGMVDDLIDPQREINTRRSSQVDILTRIAHSGWMWHSNSMEEEEKEKIENHGGAAGLNLEWKGDPSMKPERITPGQMPTGIEKLEEKATLDLKEIAGINDSALGQIDRVQSGRAIEARQKQSILGLDPYMNNFERTINLLGDKKLEIIQNHYVEPRIFRILGTDGKWSDIGINKAEVTGEILNNVTVGKYVTQTDETPLSDTFMNAQYEEMKELIESGIVPLAAGQDIMVDLSSAPQKELLKQRIAAIQKAQGILTADEFMALQAQGIPVSASQLVQMQPPGGAGSPPGQPPQGDGMAAPNMAPPTPGPVAPGPSVPGQ